MDRWLQAFPYTQCWGCRDHRCQAAEGGPDAHSQGTAPAGIGRSLCSPADSVQTRNKASTYQPPLYCCSGGLGGGRGSPVGCLHRAESNSTICASVFQRVPIPPSSPRGAARIRREGPIPSSRQCNEGRVSSELSPFPASQYKIHHHHHLSVNGEDRWDTTGDFATSFLYFSLFSTALWDLANSRHVHSLMLSFHLFLCLPCLLPPFTVPCKMVLARRDERET